MRHLSLTFATLLVVSLTHAQVFDGYQFFDSITVKHNGNALINPWAGGLNNPQFSEIDLNGDMVKDLFVFDRDGEIVKTYINGGTPNQVDYHHAFDYQDDFPTNITGFVLLRDYDCDDREDLFTFTPGGFRVFHNTSGSSIEFTERTSLLLSDFGNFNTNIWVLQQDVPGIADIDGDGDLDILSFGIGPFANLIGYHMNRSQDQGDSCGLDFEWITDCWGNVGEPVSNDSLVVFNCKGGGGGNRGGGSGGGNQRHAGSTILTLDQDADGDHDLYLGDFSTRNLLYIPNVGNANSASLDVTAQVVNSPVGTTPVDIRFCPAAYYLDVNNSGVKDMVVAPNQRSEILSDTSQTTQNVWFYENEGQDNNPDFALKTSSFLINEMIDVGSYSNPVLADVDGDSLADLLVGNDRVTDNNNDNYGTIAYYRNTGTAYVPKFELVTSDLASISTLEIRNVYPAIGDLNNDGKPDMIVGDGSGFLHYYRNTTTDSIASFALEKVKYMDIDVSFNATPQLVDIDNDSLLDLLVGEKLGMIKYFRNAGTKDSAFFFMTPTIDTVGGILVEACCDGFSVPFYTQNPDTLDTLGTPLLLVGSRGGIVVAYDSIGPFLTGTFHPVDTITTTSRRATVSGTDLSNDGQPEFVFGEIGGGVSFWTRSDIKVPPPDTSVGDTTSITEIGENIARLRLFPNPADHALNISFYLSSPEAYSVRVQDLLGKVLLERTRSASAPGIRTEQFDLGNLTGGLYFVSIQAAGQTVTRKFVKTE